MDDDGTGVSLTPTVDHEDSKETAPIAEKEAAGQGGYKIDLVEAGPEAGRQLGQGNLRFPWVLANLLFRLDYLKPLIRYCLTMMLLADPEMRRHIKSES